MSMIEFDRPDGKKCAGYLALPAKGEKAPGVVVIQEWWGLNDHVKSICDRLAKAGYRALAPDLYRGKVAKEQGEAAKLMSLTNFAEAADQDVRGALRYLKQKGGKGAVLGFCMGGAITVAASVRVEECDAAVPFYGIPPASVADAAKTHAPVQAHFANTDGWCTPQLVDTYEKALQKSGVTFEVHRYDVQHAFFNDTRPVYDKPSAEKAWERTLAFLKKYIG
ncbi:MAG: dienelactone hydrolase family protein [Bdellovibrionota bacterium]